jgi:RNA recognition motif-containing protein
VIQPDDCRVFLANLSFEADEDDVRELASHHGKVLDIYFPREHGSEKHRGMCFVGTDSPEDAAAIVKALEGVQHLGRRRRCEHARPRGY